MNYEWDGFKIAKLPSFCFSFKSTLVFAIIPRPRGSPITISITHGQKLHCKFKGNLIKKK